MLQAKGKAEAATYIFWDSSFVCHECSLAPQSKGSGAKRPTGIPSSGMLSKENGEFLTRFPVLLGERNKNHEDGPTG